MPLSDAGLIADPLVTLRARQDARGTRGSPRLLRAQNGGQARSERRSPSSYMGRKILSGAFIPKSFESRSFFQRLIRCRMGSFMIVPNRWMSGLGFAPRTSEDLKRPSTILKSKTL
jgi:hypothetical protein